MEDLILTNIGGGNGDFGQEAKCQFNSEDQTALLISNIERMRCDTSYSDLVMLIDDHKFPCHKVC